MRVAICGGTGFIGQALTTYWLTLGHEVIIVTRSIPEWDTRLEDNVRLSYVTWDDMNHDPARFERLDALVNLAGASLSQRWTEKRKEQIMLPGRRPSPQSLNSCTISSRSHPWSFRHPPWRSTARQRMKCSLSRVLRS